MNNLPRADESFESNIYSVRGVSAFSGMEQGGGAQSYHLRKPSIDFCAVKARHVSGDNSPLAPLSKFSQTASILFFRVGNRFCLFVNRQPRFSHMTDFLPPSCRQSGATIRESAKLKIELIHARLAKTAQMQQAPDCRATHHVRLPSTWKRVHDIASIHTYLWICHIAARNIFAGKQNTNSCLQLH